MEFIIITSMSIFIKIRNIFVLLKIFYWIALKAAIKSYRRTGSWNLYSLPYKDARNTGPDRLPNTSKSTCRNSKALKIVSKRSAFYWSTIAHRVTFSSITSKLNIRLASSQGMWLPIQVHGRGRFHHFLHYFQKSYLVFQSISQNHSRSVSIKLLSFN